MRCLNRNKRETFYALRVDEKPILDDYGNETGESTPIYSEAVRLPCNVSPTTGNAAVEAFGNFTDYSRILCISDSDCPIAEDSVIWFGVTPDEPYNYVVTKKADSKNGILYAVKEVKVSV